MRERMFDHDDNDDDDNANEQQEYSVRLDWCTQ